MLPPAKTIASPIAQAWTAAGPPVAPTMNRASVNSQLKDSDKMDRRMKCQQEEFLGALKQHESDKLALGKYLKELEEKNEALAAQNEALQARVEAAESQADNYKLAFEEFKEERESLLKYWKQDQAKLQKLVGPNYDEIEINDVRLMDLATVESLSNPKVDQLLDDGCTEQPGLSPFQKRMQERTRGLQASLANETSIVYRLNSDGSLRPPSPKQATMPQPADPDKTQCYWSPIEGRFVPLSAAEKAAASSSGAALSKAVLQQESTEVRQLQRRVAELEFSATSAGITEEEVDDLRSKVYQATLQIEQAESRALLSERRQKQLEVDLVLQKQSGGGGSGEDAGEVSALREHVNKLEQDIYQEREEKLRITEQAAHEKEMFITIAEDLETEVKETKSAMEQVLAEYPHLKTMVANQMPSYR